MTVKKRIYQWLLVLLILVPLLVTAQTEKLTTWTWTVPVTGTPPVEYRVQLKVNDGDWFDYVTVVDNQVTIPTQANSTYLVRVLAVDASNLHGPLSPESDPYVYGTPGACGKPTVGG